VSTSPCENVVRLAKKGRNDVARGKRERERAVEEEREKENGGVRREEREAV